MGFSFLTDQNDSLLSPKETMRHRINLMIIIMSKRNREKQKKKRKNEIKINDKQKYVRVSFNILQDTHLL